LEAGVLPAARKSVGTAYFETAHDFGHRIVALSQFLKRFLRKPGVNMDTHEDRVVSIKGDMECKITW
jgi:hypothetical protein